jgi:ABC-2 type transport system ATP-binding protein
LECRRELVLAEARNRHEEQIADNGTMTDSLRAPRSPLALSARDASKAFGKAKALDGMSLNLAEGEWVGLLGPNGAGKTTLMHSIAGLCELDSGELRLFERQVGPRRSRNERESIGFVPQEIALYPLLTVRENLEAFARIHGLARLRARERALWALEWTGLARRSDDQVRTLSGGMKRRLNIACGVLHAPRLVLLDEPTVGVDPQARERIFTMLRELRAGGVTLLQSTHQLHEIEHECDRMLVVDRGRVIAQGPVEELVREFMPGVATVTIVLDGRPAETALPDGFEISGTEVRGALRDPESELSAVLRLLADSGRRIESLSVTRPGLAEVFTKLTGRELRE